MPCASGCHVHEDPYRRMVTEPARAFAPASVPAVGGDWSAVVELDALAPPVDPVVMDTAVDLPTGRALDLGCGVGQNSVWLAELGWSVTGVDISADAIDEARRAARAAGVAVAFDIADVAAWRPASSYDLVISTYALPARGMGRSRMLEMAAAAVASGGTIVLSELDISLHREGWMAEKHLVSTDELERHLDGFRIHRSSVSMSRHRHGYEEIVLPVAIVIAQKRTDLRTI